jgi:hypothetical protein
MAKITTKPVKLKYSKPVKKLGSNKYKGNEKFRQEDEMYNIKTRDLSKSYQGDILQKRIAIYRHWFRFIVLAKELQDQDAVIIFRKKEHKIQIDESMYEGWDLDKIKSKKFNDWFFKENHRALFIQDISRVLTAKDKVSSSEDKVTIEFDANRRLADVIKDLRKINNEQNLFKNESEGMKSKFTISGRVIESTLQNRYNALVLKLEDELTNKEIVTHEHLYIRPTSMKTRDGYSTQKERKDDVRLEVQDKDRLRFKKYEVDTKDSAESYVGKIKPPNYAITMFDLLTGTNNSWGAFQILLSVCDGYFLKHPTKTYID